ncbi:MAG: hypothetical protein FJ222_08455 [Lentisphaerae bacterium]|nr:hypothetical protein [Lentisphaerota bacterium]
MSYEPQFTITPLLLDRVERIAALRQRIVSATVDVAWIPALQADTRVRNAHSSTAIEGNPLTLEQVRAVEEGRELPAAADRPQREVLNYFAGLRYVEKHAGLKTVRHEDLFELHRIVAARVMDQGEAGRYRTIRVRVGPHVPPPPEEVSGLMFELLTSSIGKTGHAITRRCRPCARPGTTSPLGWSTRRKGWNSRSIASAGASTGCTPE